MFQASLSFEFCLGRSTVCHVVKEVCEALWDSLQPDFVKMASKEDEWLAISREYEQTWNFPNCIGAIDGKHIVIQAPANAGSSFYNYKGSHSVVLLAICDAHYCFVMVDVGDSERHSDDGVLSHSVFGQALESNSLSFQPDSALPGTTPPNMPFVIVGDERPSNSNKT